MDLSRYLKLVVAILQDPRYWYHLWQENVIHFYFIDTFPFFDLQLHDDFCTQKDLELALLRNEVPPEEFVYKAILAAKGCRFIIFQAGPEEFIQFWIHRGSCGLSYPIAKGNNHRQNLKKFLELLDELHYKKLIQKKGYEPAPGYYMVKRLGPVTDYYVNFGKVSKEVGEFANRIFTDIFEDDLSNLRATVG